MAEPSKPKASGWHAQVIHESPKKPPRVVLFGQAGVGKSSFGAAMASPMLVDWDKGAEEIRNGEGQPVKRYPGPTSWDDVMKLVRNMADDPGPYKTFVFDTIGPIETLCERYVCEKAKKTELDEFGFGAGYQALATEWRVFLAELDVMRDRGLGVCLLAHAIVRQVNDPSLGSYDAYTPPLQKKVWLETKSWADLVGYATFDAARAKDENRAIVTGERVLFTSRGSGFDAKNRYNLPAKMRFSWSAVQDAILKHQGASPQSVRERIEALAKGTQFAEKAAAYIAENPENVGWLLDVESRLKEVAR